MKTTATVLPGCCVVLGMVLVVACSQAPVVTAEEAQWKRAESTFTAAAFQQYLNAYPQGPHATAAKASLEGLQAAAQQDPRPIEGTIDSIDRSAGIVRLKTTMGKMETLRVSGETLVQQRDQNKSLSDIDESGDVRISYVNLPDGRLLARHVALSYTVSHCSCGDSCRCPLSRGCRTVLH